VRVLIVRIGAMGDVLHALPAVAALRAKHPGCFIGWAIEPRWSNLLQIAGDIDDLSQIEGRYDTRALMDRWYSVATGTWRRRPLAPGTLGEINVLRHVLKDDRFDVCVDMQGAVKSAVVGRMAGAKMFVGPAEPRERAARWLYTQQVPLTTEHVVEQGCELLGAAVGEVLQPAPVRLPVNEADERWADEVIGQDQFHLIAPTAGWGAKMWPAERYGAVAIALGRAGLRVLVNASPGGDEVVDRVVAASDRFARALPCSVGQLIALTRRASVVIGGDTGPLHLAAALERPVVGIYGPTSPARNGPYGTRSRVLRDAGSVTSHKRVPEVEAGMLHISVEEVVAAALELLREG
jgi:heptosyltransferase-1